MTAVSHISDLEHVPADLEAFFDLAEKESFFSGLSWFRNFAKQALDPGDEARIYSLPSSNESSEARMALPLLLRKADQQWFKPRRLYSLSNYYTSLFSPISGGAISEIPMSALTRALAEQKPRWDVIELKPLASSEPSFQVLTASLKSAGFVVQTYFCFGNWYLDVNGRSFEEYLESLPSVLRNTLSRKKKKLEKSGRARLEIVVGGEGLDTAIDAYNKVYLRSWKQPEPYPDFVPSLMRECARRGFLRLGILTVDGEPAAAQFWIVANGRALIYKLAYDERFADLSGGTILTAALMQRAIDIDGVCEVDYLTGDDSYKKDWMSARRERWGILAMNPRTVHGALAIARHVGGRAVKRALRRMLNWSKRDWNRTSSARALRMHTPI